MNDKQTKFFVGFFVAAGLAIIVVTVIWLGMSNFFQKGDLYSIFFDESVQGLTVEAPVKYRGVPIGRVQRIKVAADSHLIEVIIELEHDFTMQDKVIAQLKVVGITGNMFIELDHLSPEAHPLQATLNFPTEYPVIQSRSSDIKQLFSSVDEIVQKLRTIDIAGIASGLQQTMHHVDNAIVEADIAGLSSQLKTSLKQFDSVLTEANLPAMVHNLNAVLTRVDQSISDLDMAALSDQTRQSLATLQQESQELIQTTKPLIANASKTVNAAETTLGNFNQQLLILGQQTQRTNAKLNDLIDQINDQPSQLLFGDAPARRLQ